MLFPPEFSFFRGKVFTVGAYPGPLIQPRFIWLL